MHRCVPPDRVLHTTQHRLREKTFLRKRGIPVTPFTPVRSHGGSASAPSTSCGCPAVLKTAGFGYDGKGQVSDRDVRTTPKRRGTQSARAQAVLEAFVDFEREVSVVAARGLDGAFAHYGAIENAHRNHILDVSVAPARRADRVASEAVEIARGVLEKLDVVGVLCVEFFLTATGELLINELAPRPHNSGHLTFDACVTSQFEQQLRAVCGLPLGSTEQLCPAAMANLLGDLWGDGEPDWEPACAFPREAASVRQIAPRPGRKMGHLTALGPDADGLVRRAREALTRR